MNIQNPSMKLTYLHVIIFRAKEGFTEDEMMAKHRRIIAFFTKYFL